MRIVLIKDWKCRGYVKGESFDYETEGSIYYYGRTPAGNRIRIPKSRAEIDYTEEVQDTIKKMEEIDEKRNREGNRK